MIKVFLGSLKTFIRARKSTFHRLFAQLRYKSFLIRKVSFLMSTNFNRDFRRFSAGSSIYFSSVGMPTINIPLLRRNIHRIEKGLSFANRRSIFALDYIQETVNEFVKLIENDRLSDRTEISWASIVLAEYFSVTESMDKAYRAAQVAFENVSSRAVNARRHAAEEYSNRGASVGRDAFEALLRQRKSVRQYTDELPPDEVLDRALECAGLAPSSCNRQSYKYVFVRDPFLAKEVARISAGTAGWVDQIQCLVVLTGDASYYPHSANRHAVYIDGALSIMPFVLSLESSGFSTCLINWSDTVKTRAAISSMLNLAEHEVVIISIAIGKAVENQRVPISGRKSIREISIK